MLILAARCVLLLLLVAGLFLPFYLTAGKPTLAFLTYHQDRPLEIGSVYSSLPLAWHALGTPLTANYSYGSINIQSPLANALAGLAPILTAATFLAATALLFLHCRRLPFRARPSFSPEPPATADPPAQPEFARVSGLKDPLPLARAHPHILPAYTLLFLMLYILTNKVFSPQYLLWLAPLLALWPHPEPSPQRKQGGHLATWRWFFWGFLLLCLISTALTPFLFVADLYDWASETVPRTFKAPTLWITAVLIARNVLFVGLTIGSIISLMRMTRPSTTPIPKL